MLLDENTSKDLLAQHGIARPDHFIIENKGPAAKGPLRLRGHKINYPVFAKVLGKEMAHKTEQGAVRGPVANPQELRDVVLELLGRFPGHDVLVEEAVPHKVEFILGIKRDAAFGPVVMFGAGGIFTELYEDVSFRRPPIDRERALEMIRSTKIGKVFDGFRGMQFDIGPMAEALVSLSGFALEMGDGLEGVDLNPVVILDGTVIALDAKIVLDCDEVETGASKGSADHSVFIGQNQ
jgi:3-hydroxypropionyl-CoA synthetase (ADP-forming)